jgi:iron(III) transport system ATP-binding protein
VAERISIERLVKTYPGGALALREVSLDVPAGTFLVLLGPSGSGKTTLLRCLAGIERVTSGRIAIGSATVADGRAHVPPERRGLAMVFQDYALWPHLTARDNVTFALRRRKLGRPESRSHAEEMLTRVGLGALTERYPNQLSGGEQQRVALARALVAGTGLLLCDEPLSNLDADLRERMRVEISTLARDAGATTVYITHDQSEAFALADRVGVLDKGVLVQEGTPEDVYNRPATPFVARFTGLSGELPVRVRSGSRGGRVEVEPALPGAGRPFYVRDSSDARGAGASGFRQGPGDGVPGKALGNGADDGDGVVMVRPTGVRLCPGDGEEHHLAGTVTDVAFRGRGYEHAIDVPGHGLLTGVFAATRATRGERVGLRFVAEGCHLFAARDSVAPVPVFSKAAAPAG